MSTTTTTNIDLKGDAHVVVFYGALSPWFRCKHCGIRQEFAIPMRLASLGEMCAEFLASHRGCNPDPALALREFREVDGWDKNGSGK